MSARAAVHPPPFPPGIFNQVTVKNLIVGTAYAAARAINVHPEHMDCGSYGRNVSSVRVEHVYFLLQRNPVHPHGPGASWVGDAVAPRWLYDPLLEATCVGRMCRLQAERGRAKRAGSCCHR